MEKATPELKQKLNDLECDMKSHINDSIIGLFEYYNSNEWSLKNHRIFLETNCINLGKYDGSIYVAKWYERNLKIFEAN